MAQPGRNAIPRGVPSVCYVRVLSQVGGASDIIADGNALTVMEPGAPSTRHDVAQVLQRGLSDEEVCESTIGSQAGAGIGASLNPISAFVGDAATTVIMLAGSKLTKKWQYLKRVFLPFAANELFATLAERSHMAGGDYSSFVSFSAFEIQDEVITDLLRPSARGLAVSVSADEGVNVPGLHKEGVRDEMGMRRLFMDACENRASHTLPLGASIDTSSAVWEITLDQVEGDKRCRSRLVILDLPCVDSLISAQNETKQLESLTLHKSLVAFMDCTKRLSTPARAALAPFRASKLTHYLSEMLGGNAIVVGLGLVASGEPLCTRKTLEMLGYLSSAVHYPVGGKELTEVLQGLLGKYRAMILQLQDEIQSGAPIGEKPPEVSEKRVTDLQKDLAMAQMERNTAREDRARIFEMMELLKAKYSTLVSEKATQSQELIRAEEDKLSVARALVELKLENSARQEQAEKDKFELTSALLAAKNEIFDLDQQLVLARTEEGALKERSEDMDRQVQKDQEELAGVRAALQEVRDQYQRESDKNLEMSAELLTLLNQKDVLQRRADEMQQKVDEANTKLVAINNAEAEAGTARSEALTALRGKDEELMQMRRALADSELEVKRRVMELEHVKQDMERKETEYVREKDAYILQAKEAAARAAEGEKNASSRRTGTAAGGASAAEMEAVNAAKLKLEQKLRDTQRDLKRVKEDCEAVIGEKAMLEEELAKTRHTYRQKLSQQMQDGAGGGASVSSAASTKRGKTASAAQETDEVLREFMNTFTDRERQLNEATDRALNNSNALKGALRSLFDKYRETLDGMEENLPRALNPANPILEEQLLIGQAALTEAEEVANASDNFEREAVRERLQRAEGGLLAEQEKMALVLNTYKRNLEKTESKLAESRRVAADLTAQINQLVSAGPRAPPPMPMSPDGSGGGGGGYSGASMVAEQAELLRAMQEQFAKQIKELKDAKGGGDAVGSSTSRTDTGHSPRPSTTAASEVAQITSREGFTKPSTAVPQTNRDAFSPEGGGVQVTSLEEAQEYIKKLEADAGSAVSSQLKVLEKRNAAMASRCAALEEELKNYNAYMRETVTKYKKEIQTLKAQLNAMRAKAGLGLAGTDQSQVPPLGLSPSEGEMTKLPQIGGR